MHNIHDCLLMGDGIPSCMCCMYSSEVTISLCVLKQVVSTSNIHRNSISLEQGETFCLNP